MNDAMCLVSFDTDRIKDYLFATPDLTRIRGASTLLDTLNRGDGGTSIRAAIRTICPHIPDDHIIAAGGMAMALVPEALAPQVIAAVEGLYRRETVTATITGVPLAVSEHDLKHSFGFCVAKASQRLRTSKDQKGLEPFVPLTGWLHPCGGCGRYPAAHIAESGTKLVCPSCHIKEQWGKPARNGFFKKFVSFVQASGGDYAQWEQAFPQDFGAIGTTARPSGYLGFIYADGNGMGALLEEPKSFLAFRKFANGLDNIVHEITHEALCTRFKEPPQGPAPFEILLMGGDDLMLVVAADAALDIALHIVEQFERKANDLAHCPEVGLPTEKPLSMSASVVIAHDTFPIQAMHTLATELLKKAKAKTSELMARSTGNERTGADGPIASELVGAIDFMVVTEAATAGLDAVRDQVLSGASFVAPPIGGDMKYILTERPYTVNDLKNLLRYIKKFKRQDFPTTRLHAMYEALFRSRVQAQVTALATIARAKPEHGDLARAFFREFRVPDSSLPWRERKDGSFSSPLGDLIEIYPFVHGDAESN